VGEDPTIADVHGTTATVFAHATSRKSGHVSDLLRSFGFELDEEKA
jgi:hypothetical protein